MKLSHEVEREPSFLYGENIPFGAVAPPAAPSSIFPEAGIAMLRAGGNAVDAALATAIALTVVEPCSNGVGSDLFAIVWDGSGLAGLNASARPTPFGAYNSPLTMSGVARKFGGIRSFGSFAVNVGSTAGRRQRMRSVVTLFLLI